MSHRAFLTTLHFSSLVLGFSLAGCGGYSADPPGGAAGTPGTAGTSSAAAGSGTTGGGGSTATGGTGGSAAGTGGSSAGTGGGGGSGGREEPPPASCEDATPCGGMVTGVWFATSSCLPISGMADLGDLGIGCDAAPASGKLTVTGNWTIEADGTMVDTTMTTGDVKLDLPAECLNVSGTVTQCPNISAPLAAAGFKTLDCVDAASGGGCTCTGTINQTGGMGYASFDPTKNGTYVSANNTLTVTGVGDVAYPYCAEGNFMKVNPKGPKALGVVNGTVVFQKQQ